MRPYIIYICVLLLPVLVLGQQPELTLPLGHSQRVRCAAFSPDGKLVVTGGSDKTLIVWETISGKKIRGLEGINREIQYAFFSKNQKYLVGGNDSVAFIWKLPGYELAGQLENTRRVMISSNEKFLVVTSFDGKVRQYSLPDLKLKNEYSADIPPEEDIFKWWRFSDISPDNKYLLTYHEKAVHLFDLETGKNIKNIPIDGRVTSSFFMAGMTGIYTVTKSGVWKTSLPDFTTTEIINVGSGFSVVSPGRKFLLLNADYYSYNNTSLLWDIENSKIIFKADTIRAANDTFYVITDSLEGRGEIRFGTATSGFPGNVHQFMTCEIDDHGRYIHMNGILWDNLDQTKSVFLTGSLRKSDFSPDGRYLLLDEESDVIGLYDLQQKKIVQRYKSTASRITMAAISPRGDLFITGTDSDYINVNEVKTGRLKYTISHKGKIAYAVFNSDGSRILTNSYDTTAALWDAVTGQLIKTYPRQYPEYNPVYYSPDGKLMFPKLEYDTVAVYDWNDPSKITGYQIVPGGYFSKEKLQSIKNMGSRSGRYKFDFLYQTLYDSLSQKSFELPDKNLSGRPSAFSHNEKKIAFNNYGLEDSLAILDLTSNQIKYTSHLGIIPSLRTLTTYVIQLEFSFNDRYLVAADQNNIIHVIGTDDYKQLYTIPGSEFSLSNAQNYLLAQNNGRLEMYDLEKRALLYSYVMVDSSNYLVIDAKKRFDGSEAARKLLYFTCGNEIIELAQAKDQLWVPDLAERIMTQDQINNKTIEELNICAYTPVVDEKDHRSGYYHFEIKPRRGGLGETIVYVNGIEVKRYKPTELKKTNNGFDLDISEKELAAFFIPGLENPVTVKAFTSDNTISSRGAVVTVTKDSTEGGIPNMYIVAVGVNEYKGKELDLNYASKDATDLSAALARSARKLLNSDGKEHVFIYNLSNNPGRYLLPEKKSIKKVIDEIGTKAKANDILFIFFAGHGVMAGNDKQFYFLTADAATSTDINTMADAGISTKELTEWIRPQQLKAQKRVLVFDACNSGQAINDLAGAAFKVRNDEKSQQIKAIDKLNETSGLFILSASATNQSAYEMKLYSQGLLTYSLLKAIREQPDILRDGKYLDLSRWFYAAKNLVGEIDERQAPQVASNTNFMIGVVDAEVMAGIKLPNSKPRFTASVFFNSDETIGDDDLDLSPIVNLQLNETASRGGDSKFIYVTATNAPDAYSLTGRYEVKGNQITVRINIKQNKEIRHRFVVEGTKDKLKELAVAITEKASELVK